MFLALVPDNFEHFKLRLLAQYPEGNTDLEPPNSKKMIEWVFVHCNQTRLAELHMPIEYFRHWVNIAYGISFTGACLVISYIHP
jgi:hypothetical protein